MQWNINVMMIPSVDGELGTIPKSLERGSMEIWGDFEIIQTPEMLKSARILRSVLESKRNLLSLRRQLTSIW